MCLSMILGSSMGSLSESGRAGTGIRDCTSRGQGSHGASASELASSAVLVGDGDTGDTIGITTGSCLTTEPTSPTAGFSSIATISIAPVDSMAVDSMGVAFPAAEVLRHRGMASRRHMPRPALIPGRLAASTMEESQEASPPVGSRALAEASTEAEAVAADSVQLPETRLMTWRKNSCAQTI